MMRGSLRDVMLVPLLVCLIAVMQYEAAAAQQRIAGRIELRSGDEIPFYRLLNVTEVYGLLDNSRIRVPVEDLSEITFLTPDTDYYLYDGKSRGDVEIARKRDGQRFILKDSFLSAQKASSSMTSIEYSFRNRVTERDDKAAIATRKVGRILFY